MVLGSHPRRVATYSVPPWPSLAASMAAYRLRSFSESESWNIRMECSISGLYIMGGRPLRGPDGPCHGYTVRTEVREVIELAILRVALDGPAHLVLAELAAQVLRREHQHVELGPVLDVVHLLV